MNGRLRCRTIGALLMPVVMTALSAAAAAQERPSRTANLYNSITVVRSSPDANGDGFRVRPNNDLEAVNTTLTGIIAFAYNVHPKRIQNAPAWADKIPFDMTLHYNGEGAPDDAACKAMLKQALKERFGLVLHGGGDAVPSYAIHVEPAGPKLARSMEMPGGLPGLRMPAPGKLQGHNASIADLASTLQRNVLDRPVIDESGVTGRWDFDLSWGPKPTQQSLAEAMRRELGLRLDASTAPASDIVLDQVQMPAGI